MREVDTKREVGWWIRTAAWGRISTLPRSEFRLQAAHAQFTPRSRHKAGPVRQTQTESASRHGGRVREGVGSEKLSHLAIDTQRRCRKKVSHLTIDTQIHTKPTSQLTAKSATKTLFGNASVRLRLCGRSPRHQTQLISAGKIFFSVTPSRLRVSLSQWAGAP